MSHSRVVGGLAVVGLAWLGLRTFGGPGSSEDPLREEPAVLAPVVDRPSSLPQNAQLPRTLAGAPPAADRGERAATLTFEYDEAQAQVPVVELADAERFARKYEGVSRGDLMVALEDLFLEGREAHYEFMRQKIRDGHGRYMGPGEGSRGDGVREIQAHGDLPGQNAGTITGLPTGEVYVVYDMSGYEDLPVERERAWIRARIEELKLAGE